jgi:hypothetical protein
VGDLENCGGMNELIDWAMNCSQIDPFPPKLGKMILREANFGLENIGLDKE